MAKKYLFLISEDKGAQEKEELEFQAQEASQQIAADILATQKQIGLTKRKILKAKKAVPFDSSDVLKAQTELEGYEKGLKMLEELRTELFPDDTAIEEKEEKK